MRDQKMRTVIVWAFHETKNSGLIDGTTEKIIHLMAQEVNVIPREEGYSNPYWNLDEDVEREAVAELKRQTAEKMKKTRKHDEKINKKKATMSRSEL